MIVPVVIMMLIRVAILFLILASPALGDEGVFVWDRKADRVTADFRDWPLEEVLDRIAVSARWEVWIPQDSGILISGRFGDLAPARALRNLFGHLDYALLGPRDRKLPRLKVFVPGIESGKKDGDEEEKPSTRPGFFRSDDRIRPYSLRNPLEAPPLSNLRNPDIVDSSGMLLPRNELDSGGESAGSGPASIPMMQPMTEEEMEELKREFIRKADTDGDGKVTREENAAYHDRVRKSRP